MLKMQQCNDNYTIFISDTEIRRFYNLCNKCQLIDKYADKEKTKAEKNSSKTAYTTHDLKKKTISDQMCFVQSAGHKSWDSL